MIETWKPKATIYKFFDHPVIKDDSQGRVYQWFKCPQKPCSSGAQAGVKRYQDNGDRSATGGLVAHVKKCCPTLYREVEAGRAPYPNESLRLKEGSLTHVFNRQGKRTYSTRPLTKAESKSVLITICETQN